VQPTGIERKRIGPEVVNVSRKCNEIIAALDLLLTEIWPGSLAISVMYAYVEPLSKLSESDPKRSLMARQLSGS
jgi:hypothetical protein